MIFALLSKKYRLEQRFRVRLQYRDGDRPAINALQAEKMLFSTTEKDVCEQSWCTFQNQVAHIRLGATFN